MDSPQRITTDLRHLLTERGEIPEALPARARKLLEFMVGIVRDVSGERRLCSTSIIRCQRRIGGRRCRGTIAAYSRDQDPTGPIQWVCSECGRRGEIVNWQGTVFDDSRTRYLREAEYTRQGVWINGERLDEIRLPLRTDGKTTAYRLFPSHRISKRIEATGQLWLRIPALLCIELFQRAILRPHEVVAIKIGEGETARLRFSGVRYAEVDNSVVEVEFSAG
jgi:hypothetical protein